jgi:hypothetical protein
MGWRDILRSPDPSRALYLALRGNPTASAIADTAQTGFNTIMGTGADALNALGHASGIPSRAIAAAAGNAAGTGAPPVDVSDYALYGRDLETGRQAVQYGDLLAGTLEDAGEVKPGSMASQVLRTACNAITDPAMAPLLLTGAEAVGSLGGAMPPPRPMIESRFPMGEPPGGAVPRLPPGAAAPTRMPQGAVPPQVRPPNLPAGATPPSGPPRTTGAPPGLRQRVAKKTAQYHGPRG